VEGEAQRLVEVSYLDEIRNLGYEPLAEREEKRGKSFFHMMRWLKANPEMLKYAKTGWPRLKNYRLFISFHTKQTYTVTCSECGIECEVPFQPKVDKPVFCQKCWSKHKPAHRLRKKRKIIKHKK